MADIKIEKGNQLFADVASVDCFESQADAENNYAKKKFSLGEMEALGREFNADSSQAEIETNISFSDHADNENMIPDRIGIFTGESYILESKKEYLKVVCDFEIVLHKSGGIFGSWFSGNGTKYAVKKDFWVKLEQVTNVEGVPLAKKEALKQAETDRLTALALAPKAPTPPPADNTKFIFGAVVLGALFGGGYLLYNNNQKKKALVKQATLGIVSDNISTRKTLN